MKPQNSENLNELTKRVALMSQPPADDFYLRLLNFVDSHLLVLVASFLVFFIVLYLLSTNFTLLFIIGVILIGPLYIQRGKY